MNWAFFYEMTSPDAAEAVDAVLARMAASTCDEERFASLLMLTRVLDPADAPRIARVCHTVGTAFLGVLD